MTINVELEPESNGNSIAHAKLKKAVQLLFDGKSLNEIAGYIDLIPSKVLLLLNNRRYYDSIYKEEASDVYNNIQEKIKSLNATKLPPQLRVFRIDAFSKIPSKQNKYLMLIALTFRIKSDLVEEMFNVPVNTILSNIYLSHNTNLSHSIYYLNAIDKTNQEEAILRFKKFYIDYVNALNSRDIEKAKELRASLTDSGLNEIVERRKNGGKITDNDLITIAKYRVKYAITLKKLADILGTTYNTLGTRITKYLRETGNVQLLAQFQDVGDDIEDFALKDLQKQGQGRK